MFPIYLMVMALIVPSICKPIHLLSPPDLEQQFSSPYHGTWQSGLRNPVYRIKGELWFDWINYGLFSNYTWESGELQCYLINTIDNYTTPYYWLDNIRRCVYNPGYPNINQAFPYEIPTNARYLGSQVVDLYATNVWNFIYEPFMNANTTVWIDSKMNTLVQIHAHVELIELDIWITFDDIHPGLFDSSVYKIPNWCYILGIPQEEPGYVPGKN